MRFRDMAKWSAQAFLLRTGGAALTLLLSLWLAHHIGARGLGLFFLSLTVVNIAALAGRLGLENAVLRFIAVTSAAGDWLRARQASRDAIRLAIVASLLMSIALFLLSPILARTAFNKPDLVGPLRVMGCGILPLAFITLYAEMLKGVRRIPHSQLVRSVLLPALALAFLVSLEHVTLTLAIAVYVGAAALTAATGWWLWHQAAPQLRDLNPPPDYRGLMQMAGSFIWVQFLNTLVDWADILILGIVGSADEVGVYGIAKRLVIVASMVLIAVNSAASPRFAALHQAGDLQGLRRAAVHASRLTLATAGPVLLALMLVPHWLLGMFGRRFSGGDVPLAIMILGQWVNVGTGSVGQLLAMTGHEKVLRNIFMIATFVNVALNVALDKSLGMTGAAIAFAASTTITKVAASYFVADRFGFTPHAFCRVEAPC